MPLSTEGSICPLRLALGGSLVAAILEMKVGPTSDPGPKLNHGRLLCCWGEVKEGRAGGYPEGRPHEAVGADSGWPFWKVSFVIVYH